MSEATYDEMVATLDRFTESGIWGWDITARNAALAKTWLTLLKASGARCPKIASLGADLTFVWGEQRSDRHYLIFNEEDDTACALSINADGTRSDQTNPIMENKDHE